MGGFKIGTVDLIIEKYAEDLHVKYLMLIY